MKVIALISGGKDSCHAIYLAQQQGHEIVALANLMPKPLGSDDLNSYMYQTVGWQLVEQYAACMNLPLYRKYIQGRSAKQDLEYSQTEGDEVEDLYILLSYIKDCIPGVGAVTSGAIASDYQRLRVEHVCSRLNLVSLAYLWHQPQRQLLRSMIESGLQAVLVKVAALGLDPDKHLGKDLATLEPLLFKLNTLYGSHVCGEGGEYETLTLDSPVFTHGRIVIDQSEVVIESRDGVASVGYLRPVAYHMEPKTFLNVSDVSVLSPRLVKDFRRSSTSTSWDGGNAGNHQPALPLSSPKLSRAITWSRGNMGHPAFPSVHVVPDEYLPSSPQSRDTTRHGVERRPNLCEVHVRTRQEEDYMQVTLWAVLNSHKQALSSDVTENDTAVALMDLITALQEQLRKAGLQMGHVLYVHLMLTTMGHFAAANTLYCKNFPQTNPPSRTCVQLPLPPGVPLMMDVLAARHSYRPSISSSIAQQSPHNNVSSCPVSSSFQAAPSNSSSFSDSCRDKDAKLYLSTSGGSLMHARSLLSSELPTDVFDPDAERRRVAQGLQKRVLHVQSISCWAPSCIGPYSQATAYDGLLYGAGCIPLQPHSMTVLPGGDPAAQTRYCLQHIFSVATALRTCISKAMVGMTVYYCASIGRQGLMEVMKTVVDVRTHGLQSTHKPLVSRKVSELDTFSMGDDDEEDDDEEADESALDPYLRPPHIRNAIRSNSVFVAVPALPRGCLVEIQPLMLDYQWLEAHCTASGPSSSSTSSETDVRPQRHVGESISEIGEQHQQQQEPTRSSDGAEIDTAALVSDDLGNTARLDDAAARQQTSSGSLLPKVRELQAHPLSPSCSRASSATLYVDTAAARNGNRFAPVATNAADSASVAADSAPPLTESQTSCPTAATGRNRARLNLLEHCGRAHSHNCGLHQRTLTEDSRQTSVSSSLDHDIPLPHDARNNGLPPPPGTSELPLSADVVDSAATALAASAEPPQPQGCSGDVMVTTVHCQMYRVLKAFFHLPEHVFERPNVNQRLQHAVHGLLGSYGLQPEHVVQIRAWYDVNKVSEQAANDLLMDKVHDWHVNWMPVMHVCTTVCEDGTAAVLELLAKPR